MKFITTFSWAPDAEKRAEAFARFQRTGGLPPEGVKLLGRWTRVDLNGGFDLVETDDMKKLAQFAYEWNDLMQLTTTPVMDDAELGEVLSCVSKA
jgi:hypothetical protein